MGPTEIKDPTVTLTSQSQSVVVLLNDVTLYRHYTEYKFKFKNISNKDIKYIYIELFSYDRVGERITIILNEDSVVFKITGPIKPGDTHYESFIAYNYSDPAMIASGSTGVITVEFMDGTSQVIK